MKKFEYHHQEKKFGTGTGKWVYRTVRRYYFIFGLSLFTTLDFPFCFILPHAHTQTHTHLHITYYKGMKNLFKVDANC